MYRVHSFDSCDVTWYHPRELIVTARFPGELPQLHHVEIDDLCCIIERQAKPDDVIRRWKVTHKAELPDGIALRVIPAD